jgi:anti-anti-sigma factor
MNASSPILMMRIAEPYVFIKINGRATCQNSVDFKSLIRDLMEKGYKRFVMDLSNCLIMDSTFLGVLAGTGVRINRENSNGSACRIRLVNPNDRVSGLLDNLGVLPVFDVVNEPADPAEDYEPVPPREENGISHVELCKTSLEAHEALEEINEDNKEKFKDVKKLIREKIDRDSRSES